MPYRKSAALVARNQRIITLFLAGRTQTEIGKMFGIGKTAVQKICQNAGRAFQGGAHLQRRLRMEEHARWRDERYRAIFGCSFGSFMTLAPSERPVVTASPCIAWPGTVGSHGYGVIGRLLAHRAAYCDHHSVTLGSIEGQVVRHTCDNPRCVNPLHLTLGTQADNMQDMRERGRARKVPMPGEANPAAKLTAREVRDIRERAGAGAAALAREFRVSETAVRDVIAGRSWR